MKITILGCGTSSGVPRIGGPDGAGNWGLCDSENPKNRRRRVPVLVQAARKTGLIDFGPDCREQVPSAKVADLDAVIVPHYPAEHAQGHGYPPQVCHAHDRVGGGGCPRASVLGGEATDTDTDTVTETMPATGWVTSKCMHETTSSGT